MYHSEVGLSVKDRHHIGWCTVEYTGQVTFYKLPEKHGHVYLFSLYTWDDEGRVNVL